jgi:lipopolysaccharide biosynthesis protein
MQDLTSICFYLPQYHPTATNDEQWGPGFTEWTNVSRGRPRFAGHQQPRVPGELGFYDLRHRPVLAEQIALAQSHGVHGFCFYHYRFGTQRELDLPVRSLLSHPQPSLPFCLCWANENWTRAWDGRSDQLLREQTYDETTLGGLVDDLAEAMSDPRYIRLSGKPLFLIYQLEHLPQPLSEWLSTLRARIRARIRTEIVLGAVYSPKFTKPMAAEVDLVVQFPPHRIPRKMKRVIMKPTEVEVFEPEREDYFEAYDTVVAGCLEGVDMLDNLVPGVCPDWDNSVRRAKNAHILIGSTPEQFGHWVTNAGAAALKKFEEGKIPHPLLFVNAWNEWGESAVLEPSWTHRRAYLEAFRTGLSAI